MLCTLSPRSLSHSFSRNPSSLQTAFFSSFNNSVARPSTKPFGVNSPTTFFNLIKYSLSQTSLFATNSTWNYNSAFGFATKPSPKQKDVKTTKGDKAKQLSKDLQKKRNVAKPTKKKEIKKPERKKEKPKIQDKKKEREKLLNDKQKERDKQKALLTAKREKEKERLLAQKKKETEKKQLTMQKEKNLKLKEAEKSKLKAEQQKEKLKVLKEKEKDTKKKLTEEKKKRKDVLKQSKLQKAKPKRTTPAYGYFIKDNYHTLTKENPTTPLSQIMTLASEKWKNLSEEEKKPYFDQAEGDKDRRKQELEEYSKLHPKRPATAFILFCNEHREQIRKENPDISMIEISRLLGKKWGVLSDEQKKVYSLEAEKLKVEFQKRND